MVSRSPAPLAEPPAMASAGTSGTPWSPNSWGSSPSAAAPRIVERHPAAPAVIRRCRGRAPAGPASGPWRAYSPSARHPASGSAPVRLRRSGSARPAPAQHPVWRRPARSLPARPPPRLSLGHADAAGSDIARQIIRPSGNDGVCVGNRRPHIGRRLRGRGPKVTSAGSASTAAGTGHGRGARAPGRPVDGGRLGPGAGSAMAASTRSSGTAARQLGLGDCRL